MNRDRAPYKRLRRLPDGSMTEDPDVYADTWLSLGKQVEAYFPGYEASQFDPDIVFICHSPKPYSSRFSLTVDQINLLIKTAVPR